jgi:hypothetical protein
MRESRITYLALSAVLVAALVWSVLGALAGSTVPAEIATSASQPPQPADVQVISSSADGLEFLLHTPPFAVAVDGIVQVAGLENRTRVPGAPELPYYSAFIALPPGSNAIVNSKELDVVMSGVRTVASAPHPSYEPIMDSALETAHGPTGGDEQGLLSELPTYTYQPDQTIYGRDDLYPELVFSVSKPMHYRDMRLVELRLFPLRYNPVQAVLRQAQRIQVSVTFSGAQASAPQTAGDPDDVYQRSLYEFVLNHGQAAAWRSLPNDLLNAQATSLPLGIDLYKIELNQDGIYEISGAEMEAAGMVISNVNPSSIEMMHRGQPVAYQFFGNGDSIMQPGERVRFYGWAFDGPRTEKLFVSDNVFWLWSGGSATTILTGTNEAGTGYSEVTEYLSTVTREPEYYFSTGYTAWTGFPNEPDAWYWDYIATAAVPLTKTYTVTLPYPASIGPDTSYVVEITSRKDLKDPLPPHVVNTYVNSHPISGTASWFGIANLNVTGTVPITDLVHGSNDVRVVYATQFVDQFYLNRITVSYMRKLAATADQLLFSDEVGGSREFHVANLSEGDAKNALFWNVSDPRNPLQIEMEASHVISGSGSHTYTVAVSQSVPGNRYLLTTVANILTGTQISQYTATSLDPVGDQADWLAISHRDFVTEANRLANHRSDPDFGDMTSHVVDVDDVINQYGYGLPLPVAIHDYLSYALGNWTRAPGYVVLVGDATQNPKNLHCLARCGPWDKDEPSYVLTDLVFKDRFQGMIPTDHTFVLLSGNDLLPDMAIGRLPVRTAAEAAAVVDKIIEYELNLLGPQTWQKNYLFVADNADFGGDFCGANLTTGSFLPTSINQTHLCLDPDGPISNTNILTTLMSAEINGTGVSVLNYRGHGSIQRWANEQILTTNSTDFWSNSGKPVTILSADCLDGHVAWPGVQSLGEVFLRLDDAGSVAHWSSSGLGYTGEHTVLHTGFLEGAFSMGLTSIGDAINYAKVKYHTGGFHESEMYSFNLLGDPAMQLAQLDYKLFLPAVLSP